MLVFGRKHPSPHRGLNYVRYLLLLYEAKSQRWWYWRKMFDIQHVCHEKEERARPRHSKLSRIIKRVSTSTLKQSHDAVAFRTRCWPPRRRRSQGKQALLLFLQPVLRVTPHHGRREPGGHRLPLLLLLHPVLHRSEVLRWRLSWVRRERATVIRIWWASRVASSPQNHIN